MATISGRVIFDRDRSATISAGDSGLVNIPVVLQNVATGAKLTVLTDAGGNYSFLNVPDGNYRIVESYGAAGGVPTPGDFTNAAVGSVPPGVNPPITAAPNPPTGATNLDSVTPDTLLVTVSGADLTNQNFLNGPVIYTPIQAILDPCAIISPENLIQAADNGTFGTFPQGTPANTGAPTEPYPGVTPDFTYVLPNPAVYTPFGGEYTVQNIMNNALSTEIGAWWRIADHTQGNETGRMMVVNGFNPGAVFFRDVVAVQPNTNYLFTSWILNLFKVTGYPNPELGVRILDQNGNVLYDATLGILIPVNVNAPEWRQIGSVINSQNNTSLTVEFLSEGPEVVGNDYAIDDVSLNEIQEPLFIPVKTVDRQVANVGETVRFTVSLTNTCSSPLTDLICQDVIPDGLAFVPGSVVVNGTTAPAADPNAGFALPNVAGGATVTVLFDATVERVPTPNPARNRARILYSYTPVEGGIPGRFDVISNEVPVAVNTLADVSVVKTASPSPAVPGSTLTYTVTVANGGPSPAVNVVLTDDIPASLSGVEFSIDGGATFFPWVSPYALGTLTAGASRTILIRGTLSFSAVGEITNTAVVRSDTPDPNPDNNTFTVVTPVTPVGPSADLAIRKTSAPNPVQPGGILTYTLTISNAGPDAAQNVTLRDNVPADVTGVEFSLNQGATWQPWSGSVNLGTLAAGGRIAVLLRGTVAASASASILNTAVVSSDTPDPDPSNNSDTNRTDVGTFADLAVTKSAQANLAVPGERLTYTITVTNYGPANAENVTLFDAAAPELSAVEFSVNGGVTWSAWENPYLLGPLAAGQSRAVLIRGFVIASACGVISNTAVATSTTPDPNPDNNTDTVNTPVQMGADLSIQKTAFPNPAMRCQQVVFTLTVSNAGPGTAERVVVFDDLPPELCRPVYSVDQGRTWQPWTGRYTVGSLPAQTSISILIAGTVSACTKCVMGNTALVSSSTADPNPDNNTASVSVSLWVCDCRGTKPEPCKKEKLSCNS